VNVTFTFQLRQPAFVSILVSASLFVGISHYWAQNLLMHLLEDAYREKPPCLCHCVWILGQQQPQYLHVKLLYVYHYTFIKTSIKSERTSLIQVIQNMYVEGGATTGNNLGPKEHNGLRILGCFADLFQG
jgi:hypothetical protein